MGLESRRVKQNFSINTKSHGCSASAGQDERQAAIDGIMSALKNEPLDARDKEHIFVSI